MNKNKTLIIAEAGVNHNGDVEVAKQLIDKAVDAGVDIVKFQTFKTERLVTKYAKQATYQSKNTGVSESQFAMLKRLELNLEDYQMLKQYSDDRGIEFLSTAFDELSLSMLINDVGLKRLKIPSGELTNLPLILAHARTGLPLILSTGMAQLEEIKLALAIVAFGYTEPFGNPDVDSVCDLLTKPEINALLQEKVAILHCTTEYPTPPEDVNLSAMNVIAEEFGVDVGLSDHSEGILAPVGAVAQGASIIEKHFTLDKTMPGPDHKASLEPQELKDMTDAIRLIERMRGSGEKTPRESESKNIEIARKSLVAASAIKAGERFTEENLTVKRPAGGVAPSQYWHYLGTVADKDYQADDLIE